MSRLRILHLTDLHLRAALPGTADRRERLSRDMPDVLDRLAARLGDWTPDVIALTGDLLDVPDDVVDGSRADRDPEGHAASLRNATADYRLMRGWLDGTGLATVVIPGNHDHRGAFSTVFDTLSPVMDLDGWRFAGFDDDLDAHRAPVRAGAEEARFGTLLDDPADDRPQIHLQHYLMAPRVFRRSAYTYAGKADLARRVEGSTRVRCVLSGHYHPGALALGPTGVVYSTAPAFCETPFPFRLVDLDGDRPPTVTDLSVD